MATSEDDPDVIEIDPPSGPSGAAKRPRPSTNQVLQKVFIVQNPVTKKQAVTPIPIILRKATQGTPPKNLTPIPIILRKATQGTPPKNLTYGVSILQASPSTGRQKTPRKSALVTTPDSRIVARTQRIVTVDTINGGVKVSASKNTPDVTRTSDKEQSQSESVTSSGIVPVMPSIAATNISAERQVPQSASNSPTSCRNVSVVPSTTTKSSAEVPQSVTSSENVPVMPFTVTNERQLQQGASTFSSGEVSVVPSTTIKSSAEVPQCASKSVTSSEVVPVLLTSPKGHVTQCAATSAILSTKTSAQEQLLQCAGSTSSSAVIPVVPYQVWLTMNEEHALQSTSSGTSVSSPNQNSSNTGNSPNRTLQTTSPPPASKSATEQIQKILQVMNPPAPLSTDTGQRSAVTNPKVIVLDRQNRIISSPNQILLHPPNQNSSNTGNSPNRTLQIVGTAPTTLPDKTPVHRPQVVKRVLSSFSKNIAPVSVAEAGSTQGPTATFDSESGNLLVANAAGGTTTYRLLSTPSPVEHKKALDVLCRVCGKRCVKWNHSRFIQHGIDKHKHTERLLFTFKIDVSQDDVSIHPRYICLSCAACLSTSRPSVRPVIEWTPHGDSGMDCIACEILNKTKGGRRLKPAKLSAQRRKVREALEKEQREEREALEKEHSDIEAACDMLLKSRELISKTPVSFKLQKVATMVVKHMMKEADADTIELPTGGPKLVLRKVVRPKVPSSMASARTVRNRNQLLRKEILKVCSPNDFAFDEEASLREHEGLLKRLRIPIGGILTQDIALDETSLRKHDGHVKQSRKATTDIITQEIRRNEGALLQEHPELLEQLEISCTDIITQEIPCELECDSEIENT